jgi:hypothetical protein
MRFPTQSIAFIIRNGGQSARRNHVVRESRSVPFSILLMASGLTIFYFVLHQNGWKWDGTITVLYVWDHAQATDRALVVAGIILNAWGLGGMLDFLWSRVGPR